MRALVLSLFLLASLLPLDARSQNAPAKDERGLLRWAARRVLKP
jgi:hypothetical protein